MASTLRWGRIMLAVAIAGFGFQYLLYAIGSKGPVPGSPWYPTSPGIAWLAAIALLAVAAALFVDSTARLAALLLDAALSLRILIIHLPRLISRPRDPDAWTSLFELLALGGGAGVLAWLLPARTDAPPQWNRLVGWNAEIGRFCVAISLVVFAVQHFLYAVFVAGLIPAWIPGRVFFAYFVGVAFIAAALAMTTKIMARTANLLLGIMFGIWVVILHLPRVLHAPKSGSELTSLFICLAMSGIGFILAARFADHRIVR